MKKIVYFIAFALFSSLAITACTEEEISPIPTSNGGGNGSADVLR